MKDALKTPSTKGNINEKILSFREFFKKKKFVPEIIVEHTNFLRK